MEGGGRSGREVIGFEVTGRGVWGREWTAEGVTGWELGILIGLDLRMVKSKHHTS